jgi:hypothetical protein
MVTFCTAQVLNSPPNLATEMFAERLALLAYFLAPRNPQRRHQGEFVKARESL